ncbi:MAG: hypothetical protein C0600_11920 [Ignavibacteria bacterium]|nr:MAG: hypothetical protein C0600_11920 [Ignavibacteria bacterium]
MLIIPALHISGGICTRTAEGERGTEGRYPLDPVQVARMWRGENAKALHVLGLDFDEEGISSSVELLQALVHAVDIPIQVEGGLNTAEDVRLALEDIGLYRVLVEAKRLAFIEELLAKYGPRKIAVSVELITEDISAEEGNNASCASCMETAEALSRMGVQRVVVTDRRAHGQSAGTPAEFLLSLVERTNLSVTLSGSVRNIHDLRLLETLHPRKIDSIILDEALYSNAFPCQKIWRKAEQQLIAQQRLL